MNALLARPDMKAIIETGGSAGDQEGATVEDRISSFLDRVVGRDRRR